MICLRCGNELPRGSATCARCGAALMDADPGDAGLTSAVTGWIPADQAVTGRVDTGSLSDDALTMAGPSTAGAQAETTKVDLLSPLPDTSRLETIGGPSPVATWHRRGGDIGPLAPGEAFGSRYHIIRTLGVGGMGAVYQAWDAELGVAVAIKVIRPGALEHPREAAELERRFKRELLLARKVTHRNVVRIHDLGEIDGIKYITMAYVEGADLATIMKRDGPLPIPRVLRIAREIVSGLVAAHNAGVVHRDLKPANIMIGKEDEALIMDFGIARSVDAPMASAAGGAQARGLPTRGALRADATVVGTIVGTVEYMAPEQARGQAVDQRADLYALGLIIYDMLSGRRRAEHAASAIAELRGRMEQAPPPLKSLQAEIPDALDHLVSKCLEPDVEQRYASTEELAAELDRLDENGEPIPIRRVVGLPFLAAVVSLLLTLSIGTWWYSRRLLPQPQHEPVSVLVADFQNSTGDSAFDGTLEQALSTSVEGASFITAYRRDDARRLVVQELKAGDKLDENAARIVSRREGIKVILAGAIQPKGSGYAISVSAVDPSNGKTLGSTSATASSKADVLKTVGPLASKIRGILGDQTPESQKLAAAETVTTTSLEALQAYERGQSLSFSNKLEEALQAYQRAIALDPGLGRAYSGMAVAYYYLKDEAKMKSAYEEALKRVDRMSEREKYRTLGTYYLTVARNYEKAIENYQTLLKLYPADNVGHGNLGYASILMGNPERAASEAREVLKIYPQNFRERNNLAYYLMFAGNFKDAVVEGSRVIDVTPSYADGYLPVALSMLASGDAAGALQSWDRLESTGATGARLARLGRIDLAMYRGRYREAQKIASAALAVDGDADASQLALELLAGAQSAAVLGQKRQAADAALKATELTKHESVLFPAALVLLQVGRADAARKIAVELDNMLQTQTTAYARLITAEIAAVDGRYGEALDGFKESLKQHNTWFAHYLRGKMYVETKHFPEAMGDLEEAFKRRGEVTDVFVWNTPSVRYLPPLYYWLARSAQAVGDSAGARKNYDQYVSIRSEADPPDLIAADSQTRLASLAR